MITNTISWPELIWTVAAGIGLAFNSVTTFRAIIDLLTLRIKQINSIREYAAVTTLLAYSSWALIQFIFVLIGANAMTKPAPGGANRQIFALACFLSISVFLALLAITIEQRRTTLVEKLRKLEDDKLA